jgi:hypothetical protein
LRSLRSQTVSARQKKHKVRSLPVAHRLVLGCAENMALLIRIPCKPEPLMPIVSMSDLVHNNSGSSSNSGGGGRSKRNTDPSLVWPTSRMSGLHTPPRSGSLGCLVRSKTSTSPDTALVAIMSGFCGMYRARLTSPA